MPVVTRDRSTEAAGFQAICYSPGAARNRQDEMALELLSDEYAGSGRLFSFIQIPHTRTSSGALLRKIGNSVGTSLCAQAWFSYGIRPAAQEHAYPKPYLLHIDEINRADLAKILGEAIYLFES